MAVENAIMQPQLFTGFLFTCASLGAWGIVKGVRGLTRVNLLHSELRHLEADHRKQVSEKQSEIPLTMSHGQWADFEKRLGTLKQVIVVADIIQEPHDALRNAVIHNFSRGVKYSFIVSKSKAGNELHGFYEIFRALAMIAIKQHSLPYTVDQLVTIHALPDYDWNGMPFVFYRLENPEAPITSHTRFKTLAFWGNKWRAGIADEYQALPGPVADALATALLSGAPQPVKETLLNMEQDIFENVKPLFPDQPSEIMVGHKRN